MDLYGSIRVMAPDSDDIMFQTDKERAAWYLERGLAFMERPDFMRLTFKPKGPGHAANSYFLQDFKNVCVVCGAKTSLSHHHVVPKCYRKWFPRDSELRGEWMYDVLLLCHKCHHEYEDFAWLKKLDICKKYGVHQNGDTSENKAYGIIIKTLKTLCLHEANIPAYRKIILKGKVDSFFGRTVPVCEYRVLMLKKRDEAAHQPMGKLIAEKIEDFDEFSKEWRCHFLEMMKPRHLPVGWTADKVIYKTNDGPPSQSCQAP